jgi:hypothetical protein
MDRLPAADFRLHVRGHDHFGERDHIEFAGTPV